MPDPSIRSGTPLGSEPARPAGGEGATPGPIFRRGRARDNSVKSEAVPGRTRSPDRPLPHSIWPRPFIPPPRGPAPARPRLDRIHRDLEITARAEDGRSRGPCAPSTRRRRRHGFFFFDLHPQVSHTIRTPSDEMRRAHINLASGRCRTSHLTRERSRWPEGRLCARVDLWARIGGLTDSDGRSGAVSIGAIALGPSARTDRWGLSPQTTPGPGRGFQARWSFRRPRNARQRPERRRGHPLFELPVDRSPRRMDWLWQT